MHTGAPSAALALPVGLIALTSLTDAALVGFPLGRPSLRWYAAALSDPASAHAALLSVGLAAGSAVLATAAGTWIALAARMLPPGWRWAMLTGTLTPLVTPGIVHAIALRMAIQSGGPAARPGRAAAGTCGACHAVRRPSWWVRGWLPPRPG